MGLETYNLGLKFSNESFKTKPRKHGNKVRKRVIEIYKYIYIY